MLRKPAINEKFGWLSPTTPYNAIKDGLLTSFIKIGDRAVGIPDFEVDAILGARIAGHTDDQIRDLVRRLHAKRAELATV